LRNPISDGDSVPEIVLTFDATRLSQIAIAAIVGLLLGLGAGLALAWIVWPVQYTNADPLDLRPAYKADYVRMIGAAYVLDGDLDRAKSKIKELGLNFTSKSFGDLIVRERQAGRDINTLDALGLLAQGMGYNVIPVPTPTAAVQTIGVDSPTPFTQSRTSFRIANRTRLSCTEVPNDPLLQISVRDVEGKELPNVAIEIRWANGEDTVYTGLKPERGLGYADFDAAPGAFTITIPNTDSETADGLVIGPTPGNCRADRGATPRGWKLVFQQK
jgi:hypothetical protein